MNFFFIYLLDREESILDKGRRMSIDFEFNNKIGNLVSLIWSKKIWIRVKVIDASNNTIFFKAFN